MLKKHINPQIPGGTVLEISSGTGQHISYFAQQFPTLTFQPSEYEKTLFKSIQAYAIDTPTKNVKNPIYIDITTESTNWNTEGKLYDYMININMMHISPFQCTIMLFKNAAQVLKRNGLMITYGPYAYDGKLTPESNVNFDRNLRADNPEWGVRDIKDLEQIANDNKMELINMYDLPSNNKCLVWINEKQ